MNQELKHRGVQQGMVGQGSEPLQLHCVQEPDSGQLHNATLGSLGNACL